MEVAHNAGYVLNDFGLDTVVLGRGQILDINKMKSKNDSYLSGATLHIIDFTYMTPYIDFKTGNFLKQGRVDCSINLTNIFQSLSRFQSMRTYPRDDFEMICNLVISMSNHNTLPDLKIPPQIANNSNQKLVFLQEYKKSYDMVRMSKYLLNQNHSFGKFVHEIAQLKYTSQPNYTRLNFMLKNLYNYEMQ